MLNRNRCIFESGDAIIDLSGELSRTIAGRLTPMGLSPIHDHPTRYVVLLMCSSLGAVAAWVRAQVSKSRDPEFESHRRRFESWASSFTPRCLKPQSHQACDQVTTYLRPKNGPIVERTWVIARGKSVATRS